MDKQTSDTVKIKINGKDRPLTEKRESTNEYQISSWEEKLKAEKEMASAKKEEDEFPWLLPDEEPIFEEDPKVVSSTKKKKIYSNQNVTPFQYSNKTNRKRNVVPFPMKQIVTVVTLAVGLGVGFGYIALNFLSNEDLPATATPIDEVVTEEPTATDTPDQNSQEPPSSATQAATLNLYAVQGGIFSAKEGADTVAADIQQKGFASAVIETDGSFTVLAGLGKEKTQTNAMNEKYKEQQFSDFWGGKQLSLSIETTQTPDQWINSITSLTERSASVINGEVMNPDELTEVEEQLKAIKTGTEKETASIEKLLEASTKIKGNQGWEAQQILLEVVQLLQSK